MITSKVNYLLALGDLVRKYRRGRISIPVYMGDSIRLPKEVETLEEKVVAYVVEGPEDKHFSIPRIVAENAKAHDEVIQTIRDYVRTARKLDSKTFNNFLKLRARAFAKIVEKQPKLKKAIYRSLFRTAKSMSDLQKKGKDTVWAFILKNLFKPLFFFLRRKKFDVLVGNPPWLSYRYVKNIQYQKELKNLIIQRYRLLPSNKVELMTHMELATLFFLRTTDLYLKNNGKIGFVMPRSVFPADQHDSFRRGTFVHPDLSFTKVFDLLNVEPLFNVPSCVFFGKKGGKVKYPVKTTVFSGNLPQKNCSLKEAKKYLKRRNINLNLGALGKRSFLTEKLFEIPKRRSDYYKKIYQGATIVPRSLWFAEIVSHPKFGVNLQTPKVRTAERALRRAKAAFKDLTVTGIIESRFLYAGLTGSELVPFGYLKPLLVVLPIESTKTKYRLIDSREASTRGFLHLGKWLRRAEKEWKHRQKEKAGRMTIYERLDRQKGLTRQNPKVKFKVVYNTSGTYLVSAVVKNRKPSITINGTRIRLKGIVIDTKLYCYETNNEDEAYYLSAILNSNVIDNAIKPAQSRGLFGPRDIHKKPFEISIPKFNSRNNIHKKLSKLGKTCTTEVKKILPDLAGEYDSIGWIRKKINESLKSYIDKIDDLVLKMFKAHGNKETLEAFT